MTSDQPVGQQSDDEPRAASSTTPIARILFEGCPLCNSKEKKLIVKADCSKHPLYNPVVPPIINWMECLRCRHVFTDGTFSPEASAAIFGKTHSNQMPGHDVENQRFVSARIVQKVADFVEPGSWLDVGFGNGSLLFTAEEWGFAPVGLDLRQSSVEAMRRLGFEAHCIDLREFHTPKKFSVISLADVLEHMPFPREGLAAAKRLLEPGGVLFVSMPNYGCAAWRLATAALSNPYWSELEHYHNFSRTRLHSLLSEEGFNAVNYGISERYRICMEVVARSN